MSKFSLSFISVAGLGIYSTISSYVGCSKFLYTEMFEEYLILHVVCSVRDPQILGDLIIQCKQDAFFGLHPS